MRALLLGGGLVLRSFPAGTKLVFQQTTAPVGWTKDTTHNDKALRVVSGTVSSGGATAFTTVFGAGKTAGSYTLATADIPAHNHSTVGPTNQGNYISSGAAEPVQTGATTSGNAGGGGSHSHTLSLDLQYADVIVGTKV